MLRNFIKHEVDHVDAEKTERERGKSYYVTRADGIYQEIQQQSYVRSEFTPYQEGMKIPFLKEGHGKAIDVSYALPEKVPFELYVKILDFYKDVYNTYRTEASAHIFYVSDGRTAQQFVKDYSKELLKEGEGLVDYFVNGVGHHPTDKESKFFIYVPKQVNSSALTDFRDDIIFPRLVVRKDLITVIETHSHHTMSAFWSGTDNAHQKDVYYYGVFGKIGTEDDFLMKYVIDGKNTNIPVNEVFEFPTVVKTIEVKGYDDKFKSILGETGVKEDKQVVTELYKGVIPYQESHNKEWLKTRHTTAREFVGNKYEGGTPYKKVKTFAEEQRELQDMEAYFRRPKKQKIVPEKHVLELDKPTPKQTKDRDKKERGNTGETKADQPKKSGKESPTTTKGRTTPNEFGNALKKVKEQPILLEYVEKVIEGSAEDIVDDRKYFTFSDMHRVLKYFNNTELKKIETISTELMMEILFEEKTGMSIKDFHSNLVEYVKNPTETDKGFNRKLTKLSKVQKKAKTEQPKDQPKKRKAPRNQEIQVYETQGDKADEVRELFKTMLLAMSKEKFVFTKSVGWNTLIYRSFMSGEPHTWEVRLGKRTIEVKSKSGQQTNTDFRKTRGFDLFDKIFDSITEITGEADKVRVQSEVDKNQQVTLERLDDGKGYIIKRH